MILSINRKQGRFIRKDGAPFLRRNRYDEVIFRICSDDMPPTVFEGAIHIVLEGMEMNEIERREVNEAIEAADDAIRQVETIRKRLVAI